MLGKGKWRNSCVCFEKEPKFFAKIVIKEVVTFLARGVPQNLHRFWCTYERSGPFIGKPAAQVSNKIDLRDGWNLLSKSTMYSDCSIYTLVLMLYARDG